MNFCYIYQLKYKCRIEGLTVINEAEEKKIITEAMEENGITVMYTDHKNLKYFTIKVKALFKCDECGKVWSSHMATIVVDLLECKANKSDCEQRCRRCPESWIPPKFTKDQFKEAIDMVITKYWERKNQIDNDDSTPIDNDRYRGNPRSPHEQSMCKRCIKLGRPCWL